MGWKQNKLTLAQQYLLIDEIIETIYTIVSSGLSIFGNERPAFDKECLRIILPDK